MKECIFKENYNWNKISEDTFCYKISESKIVMLTYNQNIKYWTAGFPDPNDYDNLIWIKEKDLDVAKLKIIIKAKEYR